MLGEQRRQAIEEVIDRPIFVIVSFVDVRLCGPEFDVD
jgi:hypothetical protein